MAIDYAVIDGQGHIGHRPDEDGVLPIDFPDDDTLFKLADPKDRCLP